MLVPLSRTLLHGFQLADSVDRLAQGDLYAKVNLVALAVGEPPYTFPCCQAFARVNGAGLLVRGGRSAQVEVCAADRGEEVGEGAEVGGLQ